MTAEAAAGRSVGWRSLVGGTRAELLDRLRLVGLVFLVNRALVYCTATVCYFAFRRPETEVGLLRYVLVRNLLKFDAWMYVRVARDGYNLKKATFFPLYPALMRGIESATGVGYATAGILISAAAFLALAWCFPRLVELDWSWRDTKRVTWILVLYPTAFYFVAGYTESLFVLLSVLSLYFMRGQRWAWAGVMGLLAGLTRNTGMLLAVPFLVEFLRANRSALRWPPDLRRLAPVLWGGLIVLSGFIYMAFLWWQLDDPLAFARGQEAYGRAFLAPWETLYRGYGHAAREVARFSFTWDWSPFYYALELVFVTLVLAVLLTSWRRLRLSYWLIILYSVLIPLTAPAYRDVSDYFVSFSRYSLAIVPLPMGIYWLVRARWPYRIYLAFSVTLFVVLVTAWSLHRWVA